MPSKSAPIDEFMIPTPETIGQEQTLAFAAARMEKHGFRHLPVLHGGALVGILSDRDVNMVGSLSGVDPETLKIEDAMTPDPYAVPPGTKLGDVISAMIEHKYGSAVIAEGAKVHGIVTTTDMLRILAEELSA